MSSECSSVEKPIHLHSTQNLLAAFWICGKYEDMHEGLAPPCSLYIHTYKHLYEYIYIYIVVEVRKAAAEK